MVRIGEHVWKHRKKPKSRNRSAAHKNVRLAATDRNDRREAIGTVQRIVLLRGILSARRAEKELAQRERAARVSGAERAADRRSGNRAVPENEKREDRPASGRRERFERRPPRRGERPEVEKNEAVKDPVQGELPFRAYMETGSLPAFRDTAATVTVQPIQRKKEGYMPMERKPAAQTQEPEPQV